MVQTQGLMRLGVLFVQAAGQPFFISGPAEAHAVCRRRCFFFLSGAFFLVLARNFSELRDFYYISVI